MMAFMREVLIVNDAVCSSSAFRTPATVGLAALAMGAHLVVPIASLHKRQMGCCIQKQCANLSLASFSGSHAENVMALNRQCLLETIPSGRACPCREKKLRPPLNMKCHYLQIRQGSLAGTACSTNSVGELHCMFE